MALCESPLRPDRRWYTVKKRSISMCVCMMKALCGHGKTNVLQILANGDLQDSPGNYHGEAIKKGGRP